MAQNGLLEDMAVSDGYKFNSHLNWRQSHITSLQRLLGSEEWRGGSRVHLRGGQGETLKYLRVDYKSPSSTSYRAESFMPCKEKRLQINETSKQMVRKEGKELLFHDFQNIFLYLLLL